MGLDEAISFKMKYSKKWLRGDAETNPLSKQTKRKCFILHYPLHAPCTGGGPAQREFSPALILLSLFSFLGQIWQVWDPNRSIKDGFMLPTTTTTTTALIFRPSAQLNVQTHKCIYPFPSDNPLLLTWIIMGRFKRKLITFLLLTEGRVLHAGLELIFQCFCYIYFNSYSVTKVTHYISLDQWG